MSSAKRVVEMVSKRLPQPVIDFVYRHRFNPVVRSVRNVALRGLGDTAAGVRISRGPLAGMILAFEDAPAEWSGVHEPEIQQALLTLITPGDVVYDIGAHLGYYVLLAGKVLNGNGGIVAYEPEASSFALLERNIELNDLGDIAIARPVGLGASSGRASVVHKGHSGEARLQEGEGEIVVTTLDEDIAAHGLPAPSFILIDTEGMEADIFRGGWKTLEANRPTLMVEHHTLLSDVVRLLEPLGYEHRDLDSGHTLFQQPR